MLFSLHKKAKDVFTKINTQADTIKLCVCHCTSDIGENSVFFFMYLWSETDVQTCDIGDMLHCQHVVPIASLWDRSYTSWDYDVYNNIIVARKLPFVF